MGVPIINGITELTSFNSYVSNNSTTYQFGSAAEALDAYPNLQVVDGYLNSGNVNGNVVEFQPNLQGGTKAGVEAVSASEVAGGGVAVTTGAGVITGVSLIELLGGIFAGLGVGVVSYEANKDFWIDISNNLFLNVPGYEPITYDNIEDMSILTLFKDGKTYVDAELVQKVNNYLIEIGAFSNTVEVEVDRPVEPGTYDIYSVELTKDNIKAVILDVVNNSATDSYYTNYVRMAFMQAIQPLVDSLPSSLSAYTGFVVHLYWGGTPTDPDTYVTARIVIDFTTKQMPLHVNVSAGNIYSTYTSIGVVPASHYYQIMRQGSVSNPTSIQTSNGNGSGNVNAMVGIQRESNYTYNISGYGKSVIIIPIIPELPLLPGAITSETPDSLPTEMPDWWAHILEIGQIDPATGTVEIPQYLPVSVPNASPKLNPVTTPQTQVQTGNVPATNQEPVGNSPTPPFDTGSGYTQPTEPTPTPTPTPTIPVIPAIGGQANKLFTVYNPSQANLDALGATLWTQNIITQIVQMFTNNPMDAIISLHILYATPTTGSNKEIKLGYVSTGVSCPEVTNQYVNVDCGTVRVPELFGDARDYANTDISIYLPMIGFRQLKTEDVMGSVVGVDYKVDVFTGTVLATVTITKAGVNQVFYTYEGNCAVNLPLTGADKSRQVATAVGAIGAMVTGSPLMGLGSATAIAGGSAKAQIQRSGNFTGNAGAMGCKKPYIIVSSDVPYDAIGYNAMYGLPANLTVMLGTCSGYVKVKEVHADAVSNATEQEKRDIENQLKQGIIIH